MDLTDEWSMMRERRNSDPFNTMHSPEKIAERKQLLRERPELKLRCDTARLKNIIDCIDFKCHPRCSLARDEAIKGSDIDGGVVIVKEKIGMEKEMEFVEELRHQGFDVYHPSEHEAADREFEQWKKDPHYDSLAKKTSDLIAHKVVTESRMIRFVTKEEMDQFKKKWPTHIRTMIYESGFSILNARFD